MSGASDQRFWDKAARRYAASAISDPGGYERTLERTRSFLRPGQHVLELGCGTGTTALRLADAVETYLATDISTEMIAIANEKLQHEPVPNLSFQRATAEDLIQDDSRFDVILGFNYLHLVRDANAAVRAIHRLLKPQGVFISKTPCIGEMNVLIGSVLLPVMRAVGKAPHVTKFNAKQLVQLIADERFTVAGRENHASKASDARPFIVAVKP